MPGVHSPQVFVHIGEPKTGTTFLQQTMWANRDLLAAQGIVLPGYRHRDHFRASRDLRGARRVPSDPEEPWAGEWDVLTRQALRAGKTAIISDELLVACRPKQAGRAVRSLLSADPHIVITVRDFGSLLPAEWQETIKCRGTVPWDEWLDSVVSTTSAPDRRRQSWFWTVHGTLANLEMWSQHIPPDHVHVITLPPGDTGALWTRFAAVTGIDPEGIDFGRARPNTSLGTGEAEFLRQLNVAIPESVPYWYYARTVKWFLAHQVLTSRPGRQRLVLPPGRQAWAREQAEALIAGLRDAKYDIAGDLGDLMPRFTAGQYAGPAGQPPGELLDIAVETAASLVQRQFRGRRPASPASPDGKQGEPDRRPGKAGKLNWAKLKYRTLNGPRLERALRNGSHRRSVRRLRVLLWSMIVRPGRRH